MNWADSSDEESVDELHPARLAAAPSTSMDQDLSYDDDSHVSDDDASDDDDLELERETIPYPPPVDMTNLPENFPKEAPFTAHVKNVAYNIKSDEDLGEKIQGLVKFRYQGDKRVNVASCRLGVDRVTQKMRGFAYVEFETPEELMLFLNINDGFSKINGRKIAIDIARPPQNNRRNSRRDNNRDRDRDGGVSSNIDGSKFRGGINRNNNNNNGGERTSLRLQPRSKPVETKPSDVENWRSSRETPGGGRGGRGRQSNGRGGGGRGKRNTNNTRNGRGNSENKPEEKSADGWGSAPKTKKAPAQAPAPPKVVEEKKNVTKVQNAFAAFAMDSDSD
jgi:RNA recognition motif-containing protein